MQNVTWDNVYKHSDITLSNNDLTFTASTKALIYKALIAKEGRKEGKWYFEVKVGSLENARADSCMIGLSSINTNFNAANNPSYSSENRLFSNSGKIYLGNKAYGTSYNNGDVIGVIIDLDNGNLSFSKNGVNLGIAFNDLKSLGTVYPHCSVHSTGSMTANFGAIQFKYNIPDGYKAYNDYNEIKLFIYDENKGYIYYRNESWFSLGKEISDELFLSYGMNFVTKEQIQKLESFGVKNWYPVIWSETEDVPPIKIKANPKNQILTAKNSIQITGIESAIFKWTATGNSRVALSVDDGISYHAFKNGVWIDVTSNMSNAMTASEYTAMTWEEFELLKGDSNFLKHQYYIPDNSTVDDILITASLVGTNKIANTSDYTISYNQIAKTISIAINKSGTYFANYIEP